MDTGEKSLRQVQVALFWGDTPIDVVQVAQKQGMVLAGSARSCAVPIPPDLLPHPDFPLLEIGRDDINLRVGREATIELESEQGWQPAYKIADPERFGVVMAELPGQRRMRVRMGRLGLTVSRVRVKPVAARKLIDSVEPAFLNSLLLAIFFSAAFISTLLLGPKALGADVARLHKRASSYIKTIFARMPDRPRINPTLNRQLESKPLDQLAAGRAGKAGKKGIPFRNRRHAVRAIKPDDKERISRMGLIAALDKGPGLLTTLDSRKKGGLGGDLEDAIGNLTGKQPGESGGEGGRSILGDGPGGGGTASLLYSAGPLPTAPRRDLRRHESRYTKPEEKHIKITVADLKTRGSLSKDAIRAVVQRNRQQIRYCFERELTRYPTLSGSLRVNFLINHKGFVKWAKQDLARGISHTRLSSCILEKIRGWRFPKPQGGGEVEVFYPFLFTEAGK